MATMNIYFVLLTLPMLLLLHEFGHYIVAKREGIYKGWAILPNPHIKLTEPYFHRWDYASGFLSSLSFYPFWLLMGEVWFLYPLFCLAAASLDLLVIPYYGHLPEVKARNQ